MHACMHAYIHTYIHTYMHAYVYWEGGIIDFSKGGPKKRELFEKGGNKCNLLREKGPTAVKRRFKTDLTAFSL